MRQFLPNQTAAQVLGWALVALTVGIAIALGRAARRADNLRRRWRFVAVLGALFVLGTLSAVYMFRWRAGVPDIIYAQDGMYEWGQGFTDAEPPGGGCQTHAQLLAHGVGHFVPAGWLTGASNSGGAWTAEVGSAGYMRVYRADRWDLVVTPRAGCYVVFVEQG